MRNAAPYVTLLLLACSAVISQAAGPATQPGPLDRPDVFPIGVWLQGPGNAERYKALGINLYVGLWEGPTAGQLTALEKAQMPVFCDQNAEALRPRWNSLVLGFLQDDEPDNAQSLGDGKGYGPPIPPEQIVERYQKMKTADPRPVMLNLGQGVAWDDYYGRGVRTNKPEDYRQYAAGGDIVSFDIYPVVHEKPVAGKLWYVGKGVQRLVSWTDGKKPVWACIECTHIDNPTVKPTPEQVRSEVWMALIHGARGIVYFSHQFKPKFIEAGLLADPEMAKAVQRINSQIQELAPVIKSAAPETPADATADGPDAGAVAVMTRRHEGKTYVFAVGMTEQTVTARIRLPGVSGDVTVLDEQRQVRATDGSWSDTFKGYEVHLYRKS
jgi:hypothetical protein